RFPRVTHPCATPLRREAFDLHVLGMPPAFVLSQDQTLRFASGPRRKSKTHKLRAPKRAFTQGCHVQQRPSAAARASLPHRFTAQKTPPQPAYPAARERAYRPAAPSKSTEIIAPVLLISTGPEPPRQSQSTRFHRMLAAASSTHFFGGRLDPSGRAKIYNLAPR